MLDIGYKKQVAKMSPKKAPAKNRSAQNNYDELLSGIQGLAQNIQALNKQAVVQYTPLVNNLISSKSKNKKQIERTLDELLTFCGYEPAVKIFGKLCRYYRQVSQKAAAEYAKIYSEMWES